MRLYKKKVLVVMGGNSKEREISLLTGKSCIVALRKIGHKVIKFDPKFQPLTDLKKNKPDLIFNALHGRDGEDGNLQSIFEYYQIPYTHSGVLPSIIAMNKNWSKQLFKRFKIRTPNYFHLNKKDYSSVDLKKKINNNNLKFPIVIKPNNEGSSIGVSICKNFNFFKKEV